MQRACGRAIVILGCLLLARLTHAVPLIVSYEDPDGRGFFDPVLGPARRAALEHAVAIWERTLAGSVPITIAAAMPSLGGGGGDALLAQGGAVTIHRNFLGAQPDTWYAAALANQLAGLDVNGPDVAEIEITFNADLDGPEVLGSVGWYYGTDANPGSNIDMVTVALHEIGHGLNFSELVDLFSGSWQNPSNQPGIFDRMLLRPYVGAFAEMRDAERLAAIISPPLLWSGPSVEMFNGGRAVVFTPDPVRPGASLAHWDPSAAPGELMAPFHEGPVHDLGLLVPALADMGWELAIASPTPRRPAATPTATATPTAVLPPTAVHTPRRQELVYVANFDDGTVSVIDRFQLLHSIPVGQGPAGVAASSDGRRVYVANFHQGTLSVISTRRARVVATLAVGASANGVAVTGDGRTVVVTDTYMDQTAIVDAVQMQVRGSVPAGKGPSAIALGPDNQLAFVADYGEASVTVIDLAAGLRRAVIPTRQPNLLGIAIAADDGSGYVVGVPSDDIGNGVLRLNAGTLRVGRAFFAAQERPQTVAIRHDGTELYIAGYSADYRRSEIAVIDTAEERVVRRITARDFELPDSMALSADGARLYVTGMGSNSLAIVDTRGRAASTIPVGRAPMGVTIARVPEICDGDCNGDGTVTVDELVLAVAVTLGEHPVASCSAADHDDDGRVTVDEVLLATRHALSSCFLTP
jgi:YVTN family beta-propeller protein